MWLNLLQLVTIIFEIIAYSLYTVVFCFWFIYLVDAMKRKRSFYKATLRCVEGESDPHEQMLAYNAKTELVKFVFLFCLNLVEWVGITFAYIAFTLYFIGENEQRFPSIHLLRVLRELDSKLDFFSFSSSNLVISMVVLGSLCMYLSARYAQKSWIKSNRIPYWICFFLFSSIASQILVAVCYTHIIGKWCDIILVFLSVVFAWKQYRKLDMVIQWSIVDLRVNGDIELLDRHVRMKRRFNRIFTTFLIGVFFVSAAIFVYVITLTTKFVFRLSNQLFTGKLLCDTTHTSNFDSYAFVIADSLIEFLLVIGMLFGSIFYIGYGLCTMCVLLWRLCRGKTGYRTHFHVEITRPLI